MDEGRGGVEANRQPLLAGRETEPETDVRLAGAGVADCDDVLPAGHILRAGELQHEGLVERRNGGEVEAVQALHGGALPSKLVVLAQERRQLERLQVMREQQLGRIGHDAAPVRRPRYVLADVIATWACGRYG